MPSSHGVYGSVRVLSFRPYAFRARRDVASVICTTRASSSDSLGVKYSSKSDNSSRDATPEGGAELVEAAIKSAEAAAQDAETALENVDKLPSANTSSQVCCFLPLNYSQGGVSTHNAVV
jgi:hypothetical protein